MYEDKECVLGGYDGTSRLSTVECFTPRTSWHQVRQQTMGHPFEREAQVANMLEPRSSFSVAFLDDRLMVMGGYR